MRTRAIRVPAILLVLAFPAAVAGAQTVLTVESSVELALKNNPDILASGLALESARLPYDNRWNAFLPDISASARLGYTAPGGDLSAGFSVSLQLPLSADLPARIAQTRLDYESGRLDDETARRQLVRDVEKEFYYLLADEENVSIVRGNLSLSEQRLALTQAKFDKGLASQLDLLKDQVSVASLKPQYTEAVSDYRSRLNAFLLVLGLESGTDVTLEGSLEKTVDVPDASVLAARYLTGRLDLQSQDLTLESLENQRAITARSRYNPSLSIEAGTATTVPDATSGALWSGADWWNPSVSVSLTVPLNVDGFIPGSSDWISLRKLDNQIARARITLGKMTDAARGEIADLTDRLASYAEKIDLSVLSLDVAQKSYDLMALSYERGTVGHLDVEDAQQSLLSARQDLLMSRYQYLTALVDLRYALNLDSLDEIAAP